MSFLLDADTSSAYLKNHPRATTQVMLHFGSLCLSTITVGELLTWVLRAKNRKKREQEARDFIASCFVKPVSDEIANTFGEIRAQLLDGGITVGAMDLFHAATAIVHDLTLVTHNTRDYQHIPGLTLDDWL